MPQSQKTPFDISKTLIIGNGDVNSIEEAKQKAQETECDGVMLGRAIFGNPWLFAGKIPTIQEKLQVLIEHSYLFEKLVQPKAPAGQGKSFAVMKKHFKAYLSGKALATSDVNGWEGARELRVKLMEAENATEVEQIISSAGFSV